MTYARVYILVREKHGTRIAYLFVNSKIQKRKRHNTIARFKLKDNNVTYSR